MPPFYCTKVQGALAGGPGKSRPQKTSGISPGRIIKINFLQDRFPIDTTVTECAFLFINLVSPHEVQL